MSNSFSDPALILPGAITNTEVAALAAIAKTKLANLDIVNADVNAAAAIAKTKLANLDIVNADVNAAAAIASSKLADNAILARVTTGSYSGNGTAGRNIAHGMGRTPQMIILTGQNGANDWTSWWLPGSHTKVQTVDFGSYNTTYGISAVDATNFVVGQDASGNRSNNSGISYSWIAIG